MEDLIQCKEIQEGVPQEDMVHLDLEGALGEEYGADREEWGQDLDQWVVDLNHRVADQDLWEVDLDQWVVGQDQWVADQELWEVEQEGADLLETSTPQQDLAGQQGEVQ